MKATVVIAPVRLTGVIFCLVVVALWVSWKQQRFIRDALGINTCGKEEMTVQLNKENFLKKRSQLTPMGALELAGLLRIRPGVEMGCSRKEPWPQAR